MSTFEKSDRNFLTTLFKLTKPHFWDQKSLLAKSKAWFLLGGGFDLTYIEVATVSLGFTSWHKAVGNYTQDSLFAIHGNEQTVESALEGFYAFLPELGVLTGMAMAFKYASYKMSNHGVLDWRIHMTKNYHDKYTDDNVFYHMQNVENPLDHPDQRIQEDPERVADNSYDLINDALRAGVRLVLYSNLLWEVSRPEVIAGVEIPKFEFLGIVGYAGLGVVMTHKVITPLVKLVEKQQEYEANCRSDIKSLHEHREAVALNDGVNIHKKSFDSDLKRIKQNAKKIIAVSSRLTLLRTFYHRVANVVPVLMATPQIISGDMKLGDLKELSDSFRTIKDSMSIYMNRAGKIYTTKGYMNRLVDIDDVLNSVQEAQNTLAKRKDEFAVEQRSQTAFVGPLIRAVPTKNSAPGPS